MSTTINRISTEVPEEKLMPKLTYTGSLKLSQMNRADRRKAFKKFKKAEGFESYQDMNIQLQVRQPYVNEDKRAMKEKYGRILGIRAKKNEGR